MKKTILWALLLLLALILSPLELRAATSDDAAPAPKATVIQTGSTHSVVLTYAAGADATSSTTYNAYRAVGGCSATFVKINTAPIAALTFTDAGLSAGNYCYEVTAVLNGAESVPSNTAPAVILPLPPVSLVVKAS